VAGLDPATHGIEPERADVDARAKPAQRAAGGLRHLLRFLIACGVAGAPPPE